MLAGRHDLARDGGDADLGLELGDDRGRRRSLGRGDPALRPEPDVDDRVTAGFAPDSLMTLCARLARRGFAIASSVVFPGEALPAPAELGSSSPSSREIQDAPPIDDRRGPDTPESGVRSRHRSGRLLGTPSSAA
jgi:hypothetical protein